MAEVFRRLGASSQAAGQSYQGAAQPDRNRDWLTQHFSGDSAINAAWTNVTQRARDLVRNEPWASQSVERIVQNVIGEHGIACEAEVEFSDETEDEETNRAIDEAFKWWMDEADSEGRSHWSEMQSLMCSEAIGVGDAFLVRVNLPDKSRFLPIAYTLFEAEQINDTLDTPWQRTGGVVNGNRIKRGIELDRWNRPVAYHFWSEHPYDLYVSATDTVRIPAERVIHYYARKRPSQTRGISWFAPILQTLHDLNKYVDAEMTAAWIAALFTVAIKRANGAGRGIGFSDSGDAEDVNGNPLEVLGSGLIADIGAEDSVEQIQANRPNSQAQPWIDMILASVANGVGMTYLGLTGDASKGSFSSARFAHNKDKIFWRTIQGRFGRGALMPARRDVIAQMVAYGKIPVTPTQFIAAPRRWLQTRLLPPGWEEIQGLDDVRAAVERIKAGLSTLQEECAGRGRNWRRILKQRAREEALRDSLELRLTTDSPSVAYPNGLQQPAGSIQDNQGGQGGNSEEPIDVPDEGDANE